jgi:endogenous inhibitor of DNA gyrase (YacG/DUF329 family)
MAGSSSPKSAKCANCAKPVQEAYRPFCSKRCADVDLSRWLGGSYAIPAVEPPDEWDMAAAVSDPENGTGKLH